MFEPSERLPLAAKAMLDSLMLDEWGAQARYSRVLRDFGNVSPFASLRSTTARRVTMLERTYLQLAEFPPLNPYRSNPALEAASVKSTAVAYESRLQACQMSVTLEQETVDRYDRLLKSTPPRVVTLAARENRTLSVESVIPAIQRCK